MKKTLVNYKYDNGRLASTCEIAGDAGGEAEPARVLLNETVLAQAQELSRPDADILLHSHLAWLKYFKTNPSRPSAYEQGPERSIYGAMIDYRRITARLDAVHSLKPDKGQGHPKSGSPLRGTRFPSRV